MAWIDPSKDLARDSRRLRRLAGLVKVLSHLGWLALGVGAVVVAFGPLRSGIAVIVPAALLVVVARTLVTISRIVLALAQNEK